MRLAPTFPVTPVTSSCIELLSEPRWREAGVRALCHNRTIAQTDRMEIVRGSIADRSCVDRVMRGITHVVHLATCKEMPEIVMDVTVKGLFWLLEAFRQSATARQFILIGGDAAVGHFFYDHGEPITEHTPHRAYPGCYALSKVLEEVMLRQFAEHAGAGRRAQPEAFAYLLDGKLNVFP
jgi:UDP-glucose 4-epimerase